jgi:hypothetical protein
MALIRERLILVVLAGRDAAARVPARSSLLVINCNDIAFAGLRA